MPGTTKSSVEKVSTDISAKRGRKRVPTKGLAGLGVLGLALLLLIWGLSATQWTILSTNNNLPDAVNNGLLFGSETHTYSIPQGVERHISVGLYFHPSSGGYSSSGGINGSFYYGLAKPVSNSTTTTEYYAFFLFTNPNGSAVNLWYTGPQGNLTQDCGGGIPEVVCKFSPTPQGVSIGPRSNYFQTPTAGNYTLHLLSTPCSADYNYCTSTTSTVTVTRALSSVTYNRPYYNSGLATAIVAGVAIAAAITYLSITGIRTLNKRERMHPSSPATPPVLD